MRDLPIFIQHSREPRTVVDNFGDVDPQEGLPAEPLDKAKNSRGRAAGAAGTAVVTWEDIDHPGASHSPHETKGLELSWNPPSLPDAVYTSETEGWRSTRKTSSPSASSNSTRMPCSTRRTCSWISS